MTVPSGTDDRSAAFVDHLTGFVDELRRRGIDVGPSELIDAGRATEVLGLGDRSDFREGLACTLLDDVNHRTVFDAVFDLWFPAGARAAADVADTPRDAEGAVDIEAVRERLAELLADDDAAGDGRLAASVSLIVDELGSYQSTRGQAFSTYQALSRINPQTLIARIAAAMAAGSGGDGTDARYRRAAAGRVAGLRADVEAETRRRMAETRGRDQVAEYAVPALPENIRFLSAGAREQAELRRTVAPLARLLASKMEIRRRRSHRGAVDVRRTLRASMTTGGVPIDLIRRKPRPGRPDLVVLCDVSGSVSGFSQFTLQLVYALRQQFAKVRVFAFVDTVDEVTDYFDQSAGNDDFGASMAAMLHRARLITRDGHSDYGHALQGFADDHLDALSRRGALLILGDARNNYHDPRFAALTRLVDRSRHAYWLNPEEARLWDSGDSIAEQYAQIITMFEARNAAQLGRVIADLLPV
ncbi:vWA domain-containing protein [Williamsia sterculiae]|uniref:VWA domain containing CoxE-like protein n=1 Tax=Williamsia sterculiae TaxID=1344003 RepID=A0A1N7G5A1_9NOCA|nr:VWA domain-containing protein [Williamsia sterculiae]SIS07783.1 hypothetical protein SAMN05445060_2518 [Williamsia sterculiae]